SVVKVNRIFTINADLVKRSMGELSVKDAENIKAILFRILEHSNKKD
ncbi:MAG: hypothetical protein JWM44_4411, partial [Bacilli bacterium]|nr:hypothetical protein [Bacilli bacterium]